MVPRIETERLILREWRAGDFDAFAEMMANPDVTRYVTGAPLSRDDSWRSMAMMIGHWGLRGYGNWAIERKMDGAFIGRAGLWNPAGWLRLELGWLLGRPYWGQGYATEAARAALDRAFLDMPLESVASLIDPANAPSQAVARRLGETRGPLQEFSVGPRSFSVEVWSITREAWRKRPGAA